MKALIPLFISILAVLGLQAQTGSIKGKVSSGDGSPLAYAHVTLKEKNLVALTDDRGYFELKNVPAGNWVVQVSSIGFETREISAVVADNQSLELNLTVKESTKELNEVVVKGSQGLNEKPISIGKIPINPMDLPQSIMVISNEQLVQQQTLRMADVLMNTNGVYMMGTTGGTQEEIAGRGFSFGSTNTFKNGARYNSAIMPEISAIERVEVIRGSNALLFGNVAAGGIINLVTKKPKFERGGELSFRTGSYSFYKPTIDLYGAVDESKKVAYRLNATYENAGSFRDQVKSDRIYFNPSLLFKVGKRTEIVLEGDYLKDNRTLDYGTSAINYKIADVPRSRFLGTDWSYFKGEQKTLTLTTTHRLNENWQVRVLGSYQGYFNDQYGTTRPNASGNLVKADGTWIRGLQRSGTDQQYYLGQVDFTGKLTTGPLVHSLLIGADADQYATSSLAYAYTNPLAGNKNVYDTINVLTGASSRRSDIPSINKTTLTSNPINRAGVYVQDLISIYSHFKLLAGLRYSYIESQSNVLTYSTNKLVPTSYYDDAFSPRLGLVYQPKKYLSIFTSYSNSFNLNTAKDTTNNTLPPSIINQYEAGVKSELFKGLVSFNVGVYKIINSNFPQPLIPANSKFPNAQELAGEVTSQGIEVDVMSKPIRGLSFIAGYSYNETRYTKSKQYEVNSLLRYNPQHTANASVYYTFQRGPLNGFNIGLVSFYTGSRVAGRSTTAANPEYKLMPIPDFVQVDAMMGYSIKSISLRLKVSNLFDELSYYVHDDNSVNPIAPRMYSITLSHRF
jgi:iron complex outermembrane receptor protein